MEAEDLLDMVHEATHPRGHVLVHVVDTDYEYWLDITDVKPSRSTDPGWVDGVVLEARPIRDGVRARRAIFTPRPFFTPAINVQRSTDIVDIPDEFTDVQAKVEQQLSDVGPREEFQSKLRELEAEGVIGKIADEQARPPGYDYEDDLRRKQEFVEKHFEKPTDPPVIASYIQVEGSDTKIPVTGDHIQMDLVGKPEDAEVPERFLGPDGMFYIKKPDSPEPGITIGGQRIPLPPKMHGEYTMFLEPSRPEPFPSRDIRFNQYRSPFQEPALPLPAPPEYLNSTDQSEPHYEAARELNEQQVSETLDVDPDIISADIPDEQARRNLAHQLNERSFLPRTTDKKEDQ